MNILKHELRVHLKSTFIWSASMFIYVFMAMMKFDATSSAGASLGEIIDSIPKALQVMIGSGYYDFLTTIGFFGTTFMYIMILGAVHGAMLGSSILSKEERYKTSEFLLVKPVKRNKIVALKLGTAFILTTIVSLAVFVASQIIVGSSSEPFHLYFWEVAKLSLGYYLIEIVFLSLGFLIATMVKRVRLAAAVASLLLFSTFFFNIFAELFTEVDFFKYLSPFSWFDPKYLLGLVDYPIILAVIGGATILLSIILSFVFYNKRDMEI